MIDKYPIQGRVEIFLVALFLLQKLDIRNTCLMGPLGSYAQFNLFTVFPCFLKVSALKMHEGETIYDYCWYPFMSSLDPDTCWYVFGIFKMRPASS